MPDIFGPITRSADHRYTFDGDTYPGVTSILKVLDKSDALMAWAARQTAEAAIAQLDNLQSLIASVGTEGTIRALTSRSEWKRDEAAQLGTEVHALAEQVIHGRTVEDLAERGEATIGRVKAYVDWIATCGWKPRLTEAMIVHPLGRYGGTFDLLAYDADGRTVLADIKTGRNVYREAVLQMAAYGMAVLVQPNGSQTTYPMVEIDRYVILHVTMDGVREIEVPVGQAEQAAFLACIELHRWSEATKGRRL